MTRRTAAGLLIAVAPWLFGCADGSGHPRLPAAAARHLVIAGGDLYLSNLCAESETDRPTQRRLRAKARALVTELARRPDYELTIVEQFEGESAHRIHVTVREFARRELEEFGYADEGHRAGGAAHLAPCEPALRRRLRALVDA